MMGRALFGVVAMRSLLVGLLTGVFAVLAAQDSWHTHRGSEQRTGTTTNARASAVSLLLAWTYPPAESVRAPLVVDNDSALAGPVVGEWLIPSPAERASDPYLANPDTTEPYRYAFCVREGENAPIAEFAWLSGALPAGYYRVYVYIPAVPTRPRGQSALNASRAEYVIADGFGVTTVYLDQTVGGWRPLGDRSFYHDGSSNGIKITLRNVIRRDSPDYDAQEPVIVVADAVRFVPDYGTVQASPVVIRHPLDPTRHLVYIVNGNGTLTCIENPIGTREARVRWTLRLPDLPEQAHGIIYDTRSPDFTPGLFSGDNLLPDAYSPTYYEIAPTNDPNNIQRAYWRVRVPTTGQYYVEAWFPSSVDNARQAEYVIEHEQGELRVRVDQRFGGRWVRLNNTPVELRAGRTYEIEVNNYSPEDVAAGARRVIADAIRLLRADGLDRGSYSTPAVGEVRILDGGSVQTRWVVFLGAQNGAIYAIDALGDGENNTQRGETKIYWVIKPDNTASFSYASPLIIGNDRLVIGNPNGSVYLIRTDLDPNNEDTYFVWEYRRPGAAFVSTPAYSPETGLVYIGSIEGGNLFGRLIALDPSRTDDPRTPDVDERVAWTYPKEVNNFIEPITATPAVALGRVYVTTGGLNGGRLYAVDARTGQLKWAQPSLDAPRIPQFSFFHSSPLVVPNAPYDDGDTRPIVYVAGEIGHVIAFDAEDGRLIYISESLGSAVYSSPIFTNIQDTDAEGDVLAARPAVVVATNAGKLLALHADDLTNARGGKAFEGWDLYAETVFASPAVLDGWLYAADDDGIVYAFNVQGVAAAPPESGLGEVIRDPTRSTTEDGGDYSKLRITVTTSREDADAVREGRLLPERVRPEYPAALEWGDRIYVIAWNFRQGTIPRTIRVQLRGPGNSRAELALQARRHRRNPDDPNSEYFVAVGEFSIVPSSTNFYTPGQKYTLEVSVDGAFSWTADLWRETPEIDRPSRGDSTQPEPGEPATGFFREVGWRFGVANPIGVEGVPGEIIGLGSAAENLFNGNAEGDDDPLRPTRRVHTRFSGSHRVGPGEHGKTVEGEFRVFDRRRPLTSHPVPFQLTIRALAGDLGWQLGQMPIRPLPWEIMPVPRNNISPDYPDISARQMQLLIDGATELQRAARPVYSTGNQVVVRVHVPRFQPANLGGYDGGTVIFYDANGNGRLDRLENITDVDATRNLMAEAYRVVNTVVAVAVDERMFVEEQTIDFGALPGGFGFNWGALFANVPSSEFDPNNPIFEPFWKPFTVRNEGNVNLYPVYLGKAFGSPLGTEYLYSDTTSFFARIPVWTTVVSTLDPRFWPQQNPFYPTNSQPYPVLQKPQVGDYTATTLTIPAVPPRRPAGPEVRVTPVKPRVSIAIPPFQPLGVYSQLVSPYQHNGNPNQNVGVVNGTFATPPMRLVVRVRETQLTGSTNRGVKPMIDDVPAPDAPRPSDITPVAFRDPTTGRLHLYWASNRHDPIDRPNNFYLYKATLNWNINLTQDGVRTTNGWQPSSDARWWGEVFGPYPNDPNGTLFIRALGLDRPLTASELATIKHHRPYVYLTDAAPFLFWTGEITVLNQRYELLFYVRLNPATGLPEGEIRTVPLDPTVPRRSLALAGVPQVGHWLFYVAAPVGRSGIFYIASPDERFNTWQLIRRQPSEQRLPLSGIVRSVESVGANIYTVFADPNNPESGFVRFADVFFIGVAGDQSQPEVLMQRFFINPRNRTLVPLTDRRAREAISEQLLSRYIALVVDEVARKEPGQNVWRARHLDWVALTGEWNRNPQQPDLDIKVNGVSILQERDPSNPAQLRLQRPVVDPQTGLMQFTYNHLQNGLLIPRGRILVDPANGTIRFVDMAPRERDVVTVTYRPRVYRVSELPIGSVGSYSQLRVVFQRTMNPRHTTPSVGRSPVRKGNYNRVCEIGDRPTVDRVWLFFRRSAPAPNSSGSFFFKTLRPGIRLRAPILTERGRLPLQPSAEVVRGVNHATVHLEGVNPPNATLSFYEYDAQRGNIYFTAADLGKQVRVRYLTLTRNPNGQVVEEVVEETHVVRWIDEGNLPRGLGVDVEYTSPVPIDLPTNELYLWAMPNLEFRNTNISLFNDQYGGLDEALLLFWSSTRNGVGNIYGAALQPRFYASPYDPDRD
ncbi:MAG: PQQ-binding-like beta-propeller repeat protein [Armatimonadota bacterium]|nr:PQQ-binding-like beta-propeller repeat protein [Armatimonadota bacterium]